MIRTIHCIMLIEKCLINHKGRESVCVTIKSSKNSIILISSTKERCKEWLNIASCKKKKMLIEWNHYQKAALKTLGDSLKGFPLATYLQHCNQESSIFNASRLSKR